jgi:putative ABC transport system permease protein
MWLELTRLALRSLSGHALRSLLTVTSITVGAFAIVLACSLAEAGLATLMRSVEELNGARQIMVVPKPAERARQKGPSRRGGFDRADLLAITDGVPRIAARSLWASLGKRDASSDQGRSARTDLVAADASFSELFRLQIAQGRAIGPGDERRAAKVCVVGPALARAVWQGSPIDRRLTIGSLRCRVIGLLADNRHWGMNFGFDWNHLVVVPHATALDHEPALRQHSTIVLITDHPSANDFVKRVVNARLVERRGGIDDFTLYDLGRVVERFESAFALMKLMVGLVAGIALVIGGVGVMNMMLISVSERAREIGIRKALGATPAELSRQFLVESSLLSAAGGLLGVAAGAGAAVLAGIAIRSGLPSWNAVISTPAVASALVASLAIGVGFGWIPARRAARLHPVEAMRR